jgi:glutamine amidotransferase
MKQGKKKAPLVVIVDYGMGNIASVRKAVEKEGGRCLVSGAPADLAKADAAILPGVGAFGQAMRNLRRSGMAGAIRDFAASGRPFLGICLGQQLVFESSAESFLSRGLGLIKGRVVRFSTRGLKVPHIGWNSVSFDPGHPLMKGVRQNEYFYFVHSYYAVPRDAAVSACATEYGGESFASGVRQGSIFAFQFHPEKSQAAGLKIYRNFIDLARK